MMGRILIVFLVLAILSSSELVNYNSNNRSIKENTSPDDIFVTASDYEKHEKIVIQSDADFQNQEWPGSGASGDPYIIEGLIIETHAEDESCIDIRNTGVHFIIRDCYIYSKNGFWEMSILLTELQNGIIQNCSITGCGIYIGRSSECVVMENIIYHCLAGGISVSLCYGINITSNTIHGCRNGINAGSGGKGRSIVDSRVRIVSNIIYGCDSAGYRSDGLSLGDIDKVLIENNTIYLNRGLHQSGYGVFLDYRCQSNIIRGNKIGWNLGGNVYDDEYIYSNENEWSDNYYSDYDGSGSYPIEGADLWKFDDSPNLWTHDSIPFVNQLNDITFRWGVEEPILEWIPSDTLPGVFEIFLNSTSIVNSSWGVGAEKIKFSLDGLYPGIVNITITVYNGAGIFISDSVNVQVLPQKHNLRWGVKENITLEFDFSTSKTNYFWTNVVSEKLAMNITKLPEILDYIEYIPTPNWVSFWPENDSMSHLDYYFSHEGMIHASISPAIPIGNWSVFSDLLHDIYDPLTVNSTDLNMSIIDDFQSWGFSFSYRLGDALFDTQSLWYKSDGSLQKVLLEVEYPEVGYVIVTIDRSNPPMTDMILPFIPIILCGIIVSVIVLIIIKKRAR
jgi:parallel beta-helix repeat protein